MKAKSIRIGITLLAVLIAVGIVTALSILGNKGKGPIENILSTTGETISKMESDYILQNREQRRSDQLKWAKKYIQNRALLKNPDRILIGAFDNRSNENFESVIQLEDSLHIDFPFMHIYTAWGSNPEQQFPSRKVEEIVSLGSIPVITWEPWLSAFSDDANPRIRKSDVRDKNGMADIAKGYYDFYLKDWAKDLKKIQSPVLIRMGHEMNDPFRYPWGPHNNTAAEFKAAWRHVLDVFRKEGVQNALWIWSPHPAYGYFHEFYPGDAFVDYVGIGTLNYGNVANWSKWWTFKEIFGKYYPQLSSFKKPILLTEFASLGFGGNRKQWYFEALNQMPKNYPLVKGLLFFHYSDDKTTTQQSLNWCIHEDSAVVNTVRETIQAWKQ